MNKVKENIKCFEVVSSLGFAVFCGGELYYETLIYI